MRQIEQIAMIAHEAVRAYGLTLRENDAEWLKLTDEKRKVQIYIVEQCYRFGITKIPATAVHENWRQFMKDRGYKIPLDENGKPVSGIHDEKEKQHSNMLPFNQLGQPQRMKCYIFASVVGCCIEHFGPLQREEADA